MGMPGGMGMGGPGGMPPMMPMMPPMPSAGPGAIGMPPMTGGMPAAAMSVPLRAMGLGVGMADPAPHGSPGLSAFGAGPFPHGDLDLRLLEMPLAPLETRIHRPLEGRQYYFLAPGADATDIGASPADPHRKPG